MSKLRQHKKLVLHWQAGRLRAFSLAELIISIAILLLMLSLAGQVFNLTVKSTGQATALTRVDQDFRVLEQTLREDLRHVQPGQSVMVIQGNPVNAYWSRNGKEADDDPTVLNGGPANGYPHNPDPERDHLDPQGNHIPIPPRADMLMFFTARPGSSHVNPTVSSNAQQIVYGHAEIGDFSTAAGPASPTPSCENSYTFNPPPTSLKAVPTALAGTVDYPSPTTVSAIPAEQWHLARRAVLLQAGDRPIANPVTKYGLDYSAATTAIDDPLILHGSADTLWNFDFVREVLQSQKSSAYAAPLSVPAIFRKGITSHVPYNDRSQLSLAPPALCADHLGSYFLPNCASFKVEWSLNPRSEFVAGQLDGIGETLWFDPGDVGDAVKPARPLRSLTTKIDQIKADPTKPDPQCKSDKCVKLSSLLCNQVFHADGACPYSLADRFDPSVAKDYCKPAHTKSIWPQLSPDKDRPNLALFNASHPFCTCDGVTTDWATSSEANVPDDIFPGALRITVDLYDPERRLDKPIRHVMVIPIGE
ncbi:MAG: hypothetical protein HY287_12315 [Planctomycetes bacterium]|nr:hypothetical protein [Planctomycetota bacterium]MBI3835105.1 hypothetical protein [Planctomycetota bacterium]